MSLVDARESEPLSQEERMRDAYNQQALADEEDMDKDYDEDGNVRHSCTDILCLIVFLAAMIGLSGTLHYASKNGADYRRLYHGFDFQGRLCGVDDGVEDKSYLYWCSDPLEVAGQNFDDVMPSEYKNLDLAHPICVESCPDSTTTHSQCYQGQTTADGSPNSVGSFTRTIEYTYKNVRDYKTVDYMTRYCMPDPDDYSDMFDQAINSFQDSWYTRWLFNLGECVNSWPALLAAAIIAIILGYVYLYILRSFAVCLVWTCLLILCFIPLLAGGYFLYIGFADPEDTKEYLSTGDQTYDQVAGFSCLGIGVIFWVITCCCRQALTVAAGCVEAACECIFDMPTLLLEPLLSLISKGVWMSLMISGFLYLATAGEMSPEKISVGDTEINGLGRSFDYTWDEWGYILYYIFMIFWMYELVNAVSQFCLAYSVKLWYFTPYDADGTKDAPCFPLCQGYIVAFVYHLGSMAFGSFVIAVLRMIRAILQYLAKQAEGDGNAACAAVAKICLCLVTCFQRFIEFLNKNAYIDIAIRSSNFCGAAYNAFHVILSEIAAIGILNGATWVFKWTGIGAVTAAGILLVELIIDTFDYFTDTSSDGYIENEVPVLFFAGVICFVITAGFMMVFDMVADTMLYCYAVDKKNARKFGGQNAQYAPARLYQLIQNGA